MKSAIAALLLLAACSEPAPVPTAHGSREPPPGGERAAPQTIVAATTPEQALGMASGYFDFLRRGEYALAWSTWPGPGSEVTEADFVRKFDKYAGYEFRLGEPATEGAAGSIYITIPVEVTAPLKAGGVERLAGTVTMRRVNDVDGSTLAQRSWRFTDIELTPAP